MDPFRRGLSVRLSVCLSGSHTFLVVTHIYVSQSTHALLGMLLLCFTIFFGGYTLHMLSLQGWTIDISITSQGRNLFKLSQKITYV